MAIKLTQNHKGILTAIGSCFFYLVIGSIYIWGNINIYVYSYYKDVTSDQGSIVFPISTSVSNIGILLSFPLINRLGFRNLQIIASVFLFVFMFATSFCKSFWTFFICFGLGFGASTGLLFLTLLYNTFKYFPSKRGLIGGILMGFYGVAPLISNYILLLLMNPDNVQAEKDVNGEYRFPDEIYKRLPSTLRSLSYYLLGVMVVGNLLQFEFKEPFEQSDSIVEEDEPHLKTHILPKNSKIASSDNYDEEKYKWHFSEDEEININHESNQEVTEISQKEVIKKKNVKSLEKKTKPDWSASSIDLNDERRCFSFSDAMKSKALYLLLFMMYLSISNGYFMASNFKTYGMTKICDDGFLTLVGSLSALCNGGGRFFWGFLSDKFNFKKVYLIILLIQIIDVATIQFISEYKISYLLWVCLALLCEGGHFVIFPPETLKVFGPNVGSKVYSALLISCACSNLTTFGLNLGLRHLIGFDNETFIYLGFTVLCFVICLSTNIKFK